MPISIRIVSAKHDRYCSSCTAHRKPNYDDLVFYRVEKSTSKNSNGLVEMMCIDCVIEFQAQLHQAQYGNSIN